MPRYRSVRRISQSQATVEGAGVRLHRAIGFGDPGEFDPFLLLDDFRSQSPDDYIRGFPWHPHRGMETITYVLRGRVEHQDSMKHRGVIGAGDVQWMTAGSGVLHQEMPEGDADGVMYGFQLWSNLPAAQKMMKPRYRGITADEIPTVQSASGARVKVVAGTFGGQRGPVRDVVSDPEYLDIELDPDAELSHTSPRQHTVFAYVIGGQGRFNGETAADGQLVAFDDDGDIAVSTSGQSLRFLLISGKPIREPIAWQGPIVMNTERELALAYHELENGTFIKS